MQWRVSLHHYSNNQACQTFTEEVLLCFRKVNMLYVWGQALALELVLMWLLKPCLMKMLWWVCSSCIPNRFTLGHCSCWDPTNTIPQHWNNLEGVSEEIQGKGGFDKTRKASAPAPGKAQTVQWNIISWAHTSCLFTLPRPIFSGHTGLRVELCFRHIALY